MCGIAGLIDFDGRDDKIDLLRSMLAYIRHRGPDSFGIYQDAKAGLASSRLKIIDLEGGDQPIHNEDRTIWVVYNGEIFNYPEIKATLEEKGHRFYTATDTELLVHLYEDFGNDLFSRLNGQYACAIWDQKREVLILGRDRVGIRPLFYYHRHGRIVFASEIKALFADERIERNFDSGTLGDIFTCWSPFGNKTIFKNVFQIMPGHFAEFSKRGLSHHQYWKISFSDGRWDNTCQEWIDELDDLIRDAVKIRLRADVPVGAYLSGGLDSTLVTSIVKKHFNNRLCTFSVGFRDDRYDETEFQNRAVDAIGTAHNSIHCHEEDIERIFEDVVWHSEQPILRTAPAPLFILSDLVNRNQFKVVLTGEGADEIFAGYDIFKEDKIRRFWARDIESKWRPMILKRIYPDIFSGAHATTGKYLEGFFKKGILKTDSAIYSHQIRWDNTSMLRSMFSDELKNELSKEVSFVERYIESLPDDFMIWDPLSKAQYTEITLFLSNYLLSAQGDRMSMAHAVEGRYPFLDFRVIELATKIPPMLRLSGLNEKHILRKMAERYLPKDLAYRAKKPYRAPISRCFFSRNADFYMNELLSESSLRKSGLFNNGKVEKIVEKCRKKNGFLESERENMAVVGIISTEILYRLYIESYERNRVKIPEGIRIYNSGTAIEDYVI